jgi:hypothetical protein
LDSGGGDPYIGGHYELGGKQFTIAGAGDTVYGLALLN